MNVVREWWLRRFRMEKHLWLLKVLIFLKSKRIADIAATHWNAQTKYELDYYKKMRGLGRLFLGYEGSLDCYGAPGRDSSEFHEAVFSRMAESLEFIAGRVSRRVHFEVVMNNPKSFPLDHLKYRILILAHKAIVAAKRWALPAYCAVSTATIIYLAFLLNQQ